MNHSGYHWTIRPTDHDWLWEVREREGGQLSSAGRAPSRAVAAAMVVRALARGVTAPEPLRAAA